LDRPGSREPAAAAGVAGVWLGVSPPREPIDTLLLAMLAASQPSTGLREAIVEELGRPAKLTDVILECLGLRAVGVDRSGAYPLYLVAPKPGRDPWREALTLPGGDCPIGFVVGTADHGRIALVHEVFGRFGESQRDLVRRLAALAARAEPHDRIVERLSLEVEGFAATLAAARRQVQALDPSVLVSPDGQVRVQLGSLSQTTRNLLREGLHGEQLFLLPANLFEGKTNHGDIEFLVYLNFFARHGLRTRIAGTARQREILERVLALTIFGLFEPGTAVLPSFEEVRRRCGGLDRETYELFVTAFRTFGVRTSSDPDSPMLAVSDYVDYTVLGEHDTTIPMGPSRETEVWVKPNERGFDVRIVGPAGLVTKALELSTPHRIGGIVPDECQRALRFSIHRPRFGVTSLGTSHGFDPSGDLTSFVVWVNGKGILVDPSPEALAYLDRIGVAAVDVPYVFLTHVHADHDGGLIEKLLSGRRTTVIASNAVFRAFAEKTRLITGHSFEGEGLVKHVSANPGHPVQIELAGEPVTIETRWNFHPIPTNGLRLSCGGRRFGYSGDTKYDPALLRDLRDRGGLTEAQYDALMYFFWTPDEMPSVDLLYHEAGVPPIHTPLAHLAALPAHVRARTRVVHVADRDVPAGSSPAKPLPFETHVLLPPTPESRERTLLETIRLVGYLYDAPPGLLRELLERGEIMTYAPGEVIVRKGAVEPGEPLHFFVVADGRVAVKDGRRLIAYLVKADSFGEWGISHQRGFRVADVVAVQATQCLRLGEAQYRGLVERHPVVQERISKIRGLLPRLQVAQERARLKREADVAARRSVLETMTANQLASFALFTEIKTLQNGEEVITEGDPADGFYALLSGHLVASRAGRPVGELSEGDVFGEMGLLEGGRRRATITVVSADAEALFMSTRNFRELLRSVPAFAWDIWETAADRRGVARRSGGER
jgi:CRP-like cAMP-binding protein